MISLGTLAAAICFSVFEVRLNRAFFSINAACKIGVSIIPESLIMVLTLQGADAAVRAAAAARLN